VDDDGLWIEPDQQSKNCTRDEIVAIQREICVVWNLGSERDQAFAFFAITGHMIDTVIAPTTDPSPPLRCKLIGEGGAGKSHVVKAITAFLRRAGVAYMFQRAAYSGVAAISIEGSTIHSLMGWKLRHGTGKRSTQPGGTGPSGDVMRRLESTQYLLLDEWYSSLSYILLPKPSHVNSRLNFAVR
jgi:hypothetical protein